MRFVALRNWELFLTHPWIRPQITPGRPVLGPHVSLKYEAELRPLDKLGLSDLEMDATLTLILTHIEGCARAMIALKQTQQDTGMTDAEWWVTQAPLLDRSLILVVSLSQPALALRLGRNIRQRMTLNSPSPLASNASWSASLISFEVSMSNKMH